MVNVGESADTVRAFMRKNHYDFPVLLDSGTTVSQLYRVTSHPRKFIIDAGGNLVATGIGYRPWDTATTHTVFDGLMARITSGAEHQ